MFFTLTLGSINGYIVTTWKSPSSNIFRANNEEFDEYCLLYDLLGTSLSMYNIKPGLSQRVGCVYRFVFNFDWMCISISLHLHQHHVMHVCHRKLYLNCMESGMNQIIFLKQIMLLNLLSKWTSQCYILDFGYVLLEWIYTEIYQYILAILVSATITDM